MSSADRHVGATTALGTLEFHSKFQFHLIGNWNFICQLKDYQFEF